MTTAGVDDGRQPILVPGFYVDKGGCWRMVYDGVGHGSNCPEPVGWTGRYVNPKSKRWQVWSCQEHLEGLDAVRLYPLLPCGGGST